MPRHAARRLSFVMAACPRTSGTGVLAILLAWAMVPPLRADERVDFNRDVRAILAENCFACHGPDAKSRQADLRLDVRESAIESAIAPGKADESELVRRILSEDADERMPPPDSKKSLSPEQKQVLSRWIAQGAEYQPHWSLVAPKRPPLPEVKNAAWVRNPIDRFILARLEAAGLEPAAEADRRTLARRVSLDLTGLPPSPELLERFLRDTAPGAYERLVDELLKSKHWGEHRGRYWLDYARYADTHGIHFDNYREMWSYRDWVIRAFNENLPFDQFTIESLAGDLIPDRTLDQLVGSGFNRCNMTTNEGGIIDEEYVVLYARDRTDTTAQVWLGMTAGCAVCHDHKFDPLSQREFYQLSAFFNNTTQGARDGNIKDTPPVVRVPMLEDRPRWLALEEEIPAARARIEAHRRDARPRFEAWLAAARPDALEPKVPVDALHLHLPLDEGQGGAIRAVRGGQQREVKLDASAKWDAGPDGGKALLLAGGAAELVDAGDFDSNQPFTLAAWVKLAANDSAGAIAARMDRERGYRGWDFWIQRRQVGLHLIHAWSTDALKVVSAEQVPANRWTHVAVVYDGSRKAAGVAIYIDGKPQKTNVEADALRGSARIDVPLKIGQRHTSDPLHAAAVADLRIYERALAALEVEALGGSARLAEIIAKPPAERTAAEVETLYLWWLGAEDEDFARLGAALAALEREQIEIQSRGTIAHVMQERNNPAIAFVLFRGEYDKRREQVPADVPSFLPPLPEGLPRNRLGLAQWLLLPEHPLTARVTVNRFWQEVFGTGLVRTTGDFGMMGELPSHPELLDWLAVEFRETGWDVKRLFKLLVTSAAYRQAAVATPEKLLHDRDNRLVSRGPRFRMDAEMIRDTMLAASGLLVPKLGGPSVRPYQPPGVWEAIAMNVSNTRSYARDRGENLYRRSLYTFWKRQAPPAAMDVFNAPNREFCVVRRERTNTPLQALAALNDEQLLETARQLAQRAMLEGGDSFQSRLEFVTLRLLSRPMRPGEQAIVQEVLDDLAAHYGQVPDDARKLLAIGESKADPSLDPGQLAAWTMVVNQLMNLDEVLNK